MVSPYCKYKRTALLLVLLLLIGIITAAGCINASAINGNIKTEMSISLKAAMYQENDVLQAVTTEPVCKFPAAENKPAALSTKGPRTLCGSFIQHWLVAEWSQKRWDAECRNMVDAGMQYIILQSVVDLDYCRDSDNDQNPDAYKLKNAKALYPSGLALLKPANNGIDSLKKCLEACKKTGLRAIIGLISDDRWWLYGWGMPEMPKGTSDYVKQSYFAKFIDENANLSNAVAGEIWQKYGVQYKSVIYGWYYNNEIWNIDVACKGTDGGVYTKLLSKSLNLYLSCFGRITPGLPMMLSPYINPKLSTQKQCGKMWDDIFALTGFRKGDIFCPQDSFGLNTGISLDAWWATYKKAVDSKPGLRLWANNENFRAHDGVARIDQFVKQIQTTAKYAAANVAFSWNHYYSPFMRNAGYDKSYLYYIKKGKIDPKAPSKPVVSTKGRTIFWNATDNIGICGFYVYYGVNKKLVAKVEIGTGKSAVLPKAYQVAKAGTYYISVYDFSGNKSKQSKITIRSKK